MLEVSVEDIADIVSRSTGIPVSQLTETERSQAARAGGPAARAGRRPGRRGARGRRGGPPLAGRTGRPGPADRQLPVPRPDRRREDRARQGAGRDDVRRRGPHGPRRHERVLRAAHRVAAGGLAPRVRRLRRGRAAHRGGPAPSVLGRAARRDGEGPPGRLQHAAPGARRRPADRLPGPHGRLPEHGADHDQQRGLGADHDEHPGARVRAVEREHRPDRCRSGSCRGCASRSGRSSSTGSTR